MKRLLAIIATLILGLILLGCSAATSGVTGEGSRLAEDEYSIYENSAVIFTLTDIDWVYYTGGEPFSFANPMRYKWEGHPEIIETDDTKIYDFLNNQLSTKRGLKVGDTLRQFADTYSNIEIGLPDYRISTTPSMLLDKQKEYKIDDKFTVKTSTYFLSDGTQKDNYDDIKGKDYYQYTMEIIFEYNTIRDIKIDFNSNIDS